MAKIVIIVALALMIVVSVVAFRQPKAQAEKDQLLLAWKIFGDHYGGPFSSASTKSLQKDQVTNYGQSRVWRKTRQRGKYEKASGVTEQKEPEAKQSSNILELETLNTSTNFPSAPRNARLGDCNLKVINTTPTGNKMLEFHPEIRIIYFRLDFCSRSNSSNVKSRQSYSEKVPDSPSWDFDSRHWIWAYTNSDAFLSLPIDFEVASMTILSKATISVTVTIEEVPTECLNKETSFAVKKLIAQSLLFNVTNRTGVVCYPKYKRNKTDFSIQCCVMTSSNIICDQSVNTNKWSRTIEVVVNLLFITSMIYFPALLLLIPKTFDYSDERTEIIKLDMTVNPIATCFWGTLWRMWPLGNSWMERFTRIFTVTLTSLIFPVTHVCVIEFYEQKQLEKRYGGYFVQNNVLSLNSIVPAVFFNSTAKHFIYILGLLCYVLFAGYICFCPVLRRDITECRICQRIRGSEYAITVNGGKLSLLDEMKIHLDPHYMLQELSEVCREVFYFRVQFPSSRVWKFICILLGPLLFPPITIYMLMLVFLVFPLCICCRVFMLSPFFVLSLHIHKMILEIVEKISNFVLKSCTQACQQHNFSYVWCWILSFTIFLPPCATVSLILALTYLSIFLLLVCSVPVYLSVPFVMYIRILIYTLIGILVFLKDFLPYLTFICISLMYLWECYNSLTLKYTKLQALTFEICTNLYSDEEANRSQTAGKILFYNSKMEPAIPKDLYDMICREILPKANSICSFILRFTSVFLFFFTTFCCIMAFSTGSSLDTFTPFFQSVLTFMVGVLPKFVIMFTRSNRAQTESMKTKMRITKLIKKYQRQTLVEILTMIMTTSQSRHFVRSCRNLSQDHP